MILIVSIIIMILSVSFILIDVTCCFMNDTGLIYCLTRTCAGVSGSASLKGSHQPVSTSISSDEEITLDAQKQKQPLSQITIDNRTSL